MQNLLVAAAFGAFVSPGRGAEMAGGSLLRSAQAWACVAACLVLPQRALADEPAGIAPGNWVRVTTSAEVAAEAFVIGSHGTSGRAVSNDKRTTTFEVDGRSVRVAKAGATLEGALRSLDEKTLMLDRPGENPILIRRDSISGLDVRRRQSKKVAGLLIGLVAGGAIGYGLGAAAAPACNPSEPELVGCLMHEFSAPVVAIVGALGGTVLGAVIAPGARWEKRVPLDHVQLALTPSRGRGMGLSLSLAF